MLRRVISTTLLLVLSLGISGCQLSTDDHYLRQAQKFEANEDYKQAISHLFRVIEVSEDNEKILKAAKHGAFLARTFTKDYESLLKFLRIIVLRGDKAKAREEAQFEIAEIYFSKLGDYSKAIEEFNRILNLDLDSSVKTDIRLKIVRSYYYLGQMGQAKLEIEDVEKREASEPFDFELSFLKANILTGLNDLSAAIQVYQRLLQEYPAQAKTEQVPINLAVCYEEKKDFDKAIEILASIEPEDIAQKEFIDLKIQRLKEIKELQPGAKGYRK